MYLSLIILATQIALFGVDFDPNTPLWGTFCGQIKKDPTARRLWSQCYSIESAARTAAFSLALKDAERRSRLIAVRFSSDR